MSTLQGSKPAHRQQLGFHLARRIQGWGPATFWLPENLLYLLCNFAKLAKWQSYSQGIIAIKISGKNNHNSPFCPSRAALVDVAQHTLAILAFRMVMSCWAITDSTSMSMRLNSSKQHQAPDWARPLKNRPIIWGGEGAGGGVRDQLGDLWLSSVMITCDYHQRQSRRRRRPDGGGVWRLIWRSSQMPSAFLFL